MPSIEVEDLDDDAVLLEAGSYDRYGRIKTSSVPVAIKCRWVEDVTSSGGPESDTAGVTAQVYVDREIGLSSLLWRGKLADFPNDWENINWGELVEVANFHRVPDIEDREERMWVDVTRYRDELATTE